MRTTVRLDTNILQTAKRVADQRHTTLTALIDAGLRYVISLSSMKPYANKNIKLKTVRGSGLKHGVRLDDNAGLLNKMESF